MDKAVDTYLEELASPQRDICTRVRQIILQTFPDIEESFKNGVPWYEDRFYIVGLKDHVNVGFAIGGLGKNELALFEGRGKLMRHVKIYSLDGIDRDALVTRLRLVGR